LIVAGLEILRSEGTAQLSIRKAARIVGVSQAAPYRHFENKEALLRAIAQEGFSILAHRIRTVAECESLKTEELLHQIAFSYLALARENTDHFRLMFELENKVPAHGLFELLVKVVRHCQEKKTLRDGNPEPLALILWSGLHGLTTLLAGGHLNFLALSQAQTEATVRSLVDCLFKGLQPSI
jgi:AcrR family transcriptional regulator